MVGCSICSSTSACSTIVGLAVCSSCSNFYRRAVVRKKPYTKCNREENCWQNVSTIKDCLPCRFKRFKFQMAICHLQGNLPSSPLQDPQNYALVMVLKDLSDRNSSRSLNFTTCCVEGDIDPTITDVISGSFNLIRKPLNMKFKFQDWAFHCDVTSLQYYSNFDFVSQLSEEDKKILIVGSKLRGCLFKHAADALFDKSCVLAFPDGSNFLPELKIEKHFDYLLRYRLVFRLIELKIKPEEYYLVSMILFCDPSIYGLSQEAAGEVNRHQQKYSSFLLSFCQLHYQRGAPSRFTELLGLSQLINSTFALFCDFCLLLQVTNPPIGWKRLIFEGL